MIVRMLVQGSALPILDHMEASHVWLPSFKDNQTGRRVLTSHFQPHEVNESVLKDGNRKFIYVSRNCKDVSVTQFLLFMKFEVFSAKAHQQYWEDYLPSFYNNVPESRFSENTSAGASCWWVMHVRAWEEYAEKNPDASILFMYFEDILHEPEKSIRKMAEFLSVPLADDLLQGILTACAFGDMKSAPITEELSELLIDGMDNTYRKGTVGLWKKWYSVADSEFANECLAKQMAGSKINPLSE